MADVWQQFHQLPKAIRDTVATPQALATIDRLEHEHLGLDLADMVMRVMTKAIPFADLPKRLQEEGKIFPETAAAIAAELERHVFQAAAEYLGLKKSSPATPTLTPSPSPRVPPNLPVITQQPPAIPPPPAPRPPPPTTANPLPRSDAQPRAPTGPTAPTSAYSDEDAQEIAQQSARIKSMTANGAPVDFEEMSRRILDLHHLGFSDELLAKRALAICKARLKSIRDSGETKAMLIRPPKLGGLGLDPDMAEQIVASLDAEAGKLKNRGMVRKPQPLPPPPPPVKPPLSQQRPAGMPPLEKTLPAEKPPAEQHLPDIPTLPPSPGLAIKRPADMPPAPWQPKPFRAAAPKPLPPTGKPIPIQPAPSIGPQTIVQGGRQMDRPAITDISRPKPTFGPAEELHSLTLTEFRRLGQGVNDSIRRLQEKFDHLQRQSFSLWVQAVAGWRQNEVYQLYLRMGRESLETGAPISAIVKRRGQQGQPYLSEHEFGAIADFNRRLHL